MRHQFRDLGFATSKVGLGILSMWGGYHLLGSEKPDFPKLITRLVSHLLIDPVGSLGNILCNMFTPSFSKPDLRHALALKKQYERKRDKMTTSMQRYLDRRITQYLYEVRRSRGKDSYEQKAIEEILQFPTVTKQVEPNITHITNLLQPYAKNVRHSIANFVAGVIRDSKHERLTKRGTPIMFVGPPGTGKTHLAKQLCDLLGLPAQVIDLSQYKDIRGNSIYSDREEKGIWVDILLTQCDATNPANKIIILDEVDKAIEKDSNGSFTHKNGAEIYAFLHKLLDSKELEIPLERYYNASYVIDHIQIILIGNHTFTEVLGTDKALALESRINLVQFDHGFELSKKSIIARQYLKDYCLEQGIDYAKIDQTMIDRILQADHKAGYKGVRILLKVIDAYLQSMEESALIAQIAGIEPTDFDIEQAYTVYEKKTS